MTIEHPKLYMVHVGFYDNALGIGELHTNVFVAALDVVAAKRKVTEMEIFASKKMHIDGIQQLATVDGYAIQLVAQPAAEDANIMYGYSAVKQL